MFGKIILSKEPILGLSLMQLESEIPNAPTTDGTYNLRVTVADGVPTYSWVSGS